MKEKQIDILLNYEAYAVTIACCLRLFPCYSFRVSYLYKNVSVASFAVFLTASTRGRIPSILIEVTRYNVTAWTKEGKIILTIASIVGIFYIQVKLIKNKNT
ncbi:hypothetical protein [Bacillus nitroreducens]